MPIHKLAFMFFLITNPIGNSPAILALVKDFPFEKQKQIMLREALFALLLALFFQFFGELFFRLVGIEQAATSFCGGLILFITAINMMFVHHSPIVQETSKNEPFIVPIATPLLSGAGLFTVIMLWAQQEPAWVISSALFLAWVGVIAVMMAAPYLQKILGRRGMVVLEQLMGMLLVMLSMDLIVHGIEFFSQKLSTTP